MFGLSTGRTNWETGQLTTERWVPSCDRTMTEAPGGGHQNPLWPPEEASSVSDSSLCLVFQLYFRLLQDNLELKEKLQEMELLLSQNKVELERLRQVPPSSPGPAPWLSLFVLIVITVCFLNRVRRATGRR